MAAFGVVVTLKTFDGIGQNGEHQSLFGAEM
jgi:hypothetical protein